MTAKEIRQAFLDFFASKGHIIVPSAPIVVKNDPTLMFTNAGMNQFKDVFLGEAPAKAPRVADTQRCLRVSGKHNDLEEVGIDTYHHTMFEMLGNWSFGDYFKKEAIAWSWELLTEVYKLDKSRLYVTYFEGDEKEGLEKDTETYELWKQYVDESNILPGNKKDNFWEMGETGPCGPCSEIHFDSRPDNERAEVSGATLVNADHDQVIEIWNNVFMQFNRVWDELKGGINALVADVDKYTAYYKESGSNADIIDPKKYRQIKAVDYSKLIDLPAKHVDTGMGFERLVRILQGKSSNYDTDIFQPIIQFIAEKSGKKYNSAAKSGDADWADAVAMRVLADHIRAISFAIADGQLPASNKAGYVIRRILRRTVRYSYQTLNFKEPFFNELVPLLAEQFKGVFDELYSQKDFVQKVILEEEVAFLRTLEKGLKRFENREKILKDIYQYFEAQRTVDTTKNTLITFIGEILAESFKSHSDDEIKKLQDNLSAAATVDDVYLRLRLFTTIINGSFAFELYDTYGFPIDLTELMAREIGWTVDLKGFEKALQSQKLRSRAATAVSAGDWVVLRGGDSTEFVGYDEMYINCEILKYRKVTAQGKEQYQIILNRTPFYAEGGGQVGDTGNLMSEWYDETRGNLNFEVTDTKKENGLIIHYANLSPYYDMETSEQKEWELPNPMPTRFQAAINMGNRIMTNANHSATHLLHAALKKTLGEHVNQKGSLVNPDQLRFDFSHFQKVTDDDIEVLERIVNQKVREAIPLKEQRSVHYDDAIASGVTALFGEKYGDYVRVITFDDKFSKELCGGTHVQNTAEIGFFKITGESAVAAGVRRIEAITSYHSQDYIQNQARQIKALKDLLKNPNDLSKSIENLIEDNNRMKKELEKAVLMKASGLKDQLAKTAENINGINFIAQRVELPNADAVKTLAYHLKDIVPNLFLVLAADINGKPSITVMIDEVLVKEKGLHAGNIVKELAKEVKGGGGGQPFFATAGGSDISGIDNALAKAKTFIQ